MTTTALVTTTIRKPTFLEGVLDNARRYGTTDLRIYVIGDKRTPAEVGALCTSLETRFRFSVRYYDVHDQEAVLRGPASDLLDLMPYNHGSRKMIGNFLAYQGGCDSLIMLDDDNFVTDEDFFGGHAVVGRRTELKQVTATSGWYNVCEALVEERGVPFYPRGYPWSQRSADPQKVKIESKAGRVALNQGLVKGDPDIDAISRLFWPIRVTGIDPSLAPRFGLAPGTWSSFNNQNTALCRDLIPVYFTPPSTGRNADIWTSYVICRLASHMGDVVAYGVPWSNQVRNPHDLWKDLDDEIVNDRATDQFVALLRETRVSGENYRAALRSLLEGVLRAIDPGAGIRDPELRMMRGFLEEYGRWQRLFDSAEVPVEPKPRHVVRRSH